MKYATWRVPENPPVIPAALTERKFTPLLAALLEARGLSEFAAAQRFLSGGPELMGDPLLLEDMVAAVRRITRAMSEREHVAVYGDYDVDGITAACLLTEYLRDRGLTCDIYIPNRLEEGYGLNTGAIRQLKERGVSLLITVDCGVTNLEEVVYANSLGLDTVITDHHECREGLPEAVAVVDPKRPNSAYPGAELAGVGVAFKLVCALDGDSGKMLERFGDLLAVGTVADVMPLTGENRFFVRSGLRILSSKACRPGLAALMREAGVDTNRVTAGTIGFSIAPRVNAAGRLGNAAEAVDLILARDLRRSEELARELCLKNKQRQVLELEIWKQTAEMLEGHIPTLPIVLAEEGWHQGVIGIAASRLTDAYSLPAVMICLDGDKGKGSCRSVGDFNLYDALADCADCLESFGGHAMAAGLTICRDRIDEFRKRLGEYFLAHPGGAAPALEPVIRIEDAELLSMECVESLDQLEPCGCGNPKPLLYMEKAALDSVSPIGDGKHLRLVVQKFDCSFDCVFFSKQVTDLGARPGQAVDIVFIPQVNEFRGRRVQLVITDLRAHREA